MEAPRNVIIRPAVTQVATVPCTTAGLGNQSVTVQVFMGVPSIEAEEAGASSLASLPSRLRLPLRVTDAYMIQSLACGQAGGAGDALRTKLRKYI